MLMLRLGLSAPLAFSSVSRRRIQCGQTTGLDRLLRWFFAIGTVALLTMRAATGFAADNAAAVPAHVGGTLNFGIATDTALLHPSNNRSSVHPIIPRNVRHS